MAGKFPNATYRVSLKASEGQFSGQSATAFSYMLQRFVAVRVRWDSLYGYWPLRARGKGKQNNLSKLTLSDPPAPLGFPPSRGAAICGRGEARREGGRMNLKVTQSSLEKAR